MSVSTEEFEAYVLVYFKLHPQERKYESAANIKKIIDRMTAYGLGVASDTMVKRAISELVREGIIDRADGGNEETDRQAADAVWQSRIERLTSAPLTESDFVRFSRMSPDEVDAAFFSDPVFAARYRKAAQQWGFTLPVTPTPVQANIPAETDTSQWKDLDAKTYYSIPAQRVVRLYQQDPYFKRAVDRLIREGKI